VLGSKIFAGNEGDRIESPAIPRASKQALHSMPMSMARTADPFLEGCGAGRKSSQGGLKNYRRDHEVWKGFQ